MDGALGWGSLGHILALPLVSEEVLYALLASLGNGFECDGMGSLLAWLVFLSN